MEATFAPTVPSHSRSQKQFRAGIALSALPVLFLTFDGIIKFTGMEPVVESMARLGYPPELAPVIGTIELVCLVAYVFPRTAALGAVLLTGFLGGAISAHVRVADPLFSHTLFPVYVALSLWGGLVLRDGRVRGIFSALLSGRP